MIGKDATTPINTPINTPAANDRFLQIDEEGYFIANNLRVADAEYGQRLLKQFYLAEGGRTKCRVDDGEAWVEAFDEPFVGLDVTRGADGVFTLVLPYGYSETFRLDTLSLDEWDRFHGTTERGIPFVLSRTAQSRFFELCDEFDDDSITVGGKRYAVGPWLIQHAQSGHQQFWDEIYRKEVPPWELHKPHPAFTALVPKLKLTRSRVLVLGAGSGSDAAYFAEQGHIVTAVDFSAEAVTAAKAKYADLTNLRFMQSDIFNLPTSMNGQFDLIVEHTCYCAIDPTRRNELVRIWRRLLADNGHVLGVFFAIDKRSGPPFGGSEWEIRARLSKGFQPLYWLRWHQSVADRLGTELLVYAQKSSAR